MSDPLYLLNSHAFASIMPTCSLIPRLPLESQSHAEDLGTKLANPNSYTTLLWLDKHAKDVL